MLINHLKSNHTECPHTLNVRAGRENTKSKFARKCRADRSFRCHWYDDPQDAHCIHIWPQLLAFLRCIQRQMRLTSAPRECEKIQHSATQVQHQMRKIGPNYKAARLKNEKEAGFTDGQMICCHKTAVAWDTAPWEVATK